MASHYLASAFSFWLPFDFSQILCGPNYVGSAINMPPFPPAVPSLYGPLVPGHASEHGGPSVVSGQISALWTPCFRSIRLLEFRDTEHMSPCNNWCFYSCPLLSFVYLLKLSLSLAIEKKNQRTWNIELIGRFIHVKSLCLTLMKILYSLDAFWISFYAWLTFLCSRCDTFSIITDPS